MQKSYFHRQMYYLFWDKSQHKVVNLTNFNCIYMRSVCIFMLFAMIDRVLRLLVPIRSSRAEKQIIICQIFDFEIKAVGRAILNLIFFNFHAPACPFPAGVGPLRGPERRERVPMPHATQAFGLRAVGFNPSRPRGGRCGLRPHCRVCAASPPGTLLPVILEKSLPLISPVRGGR